MEAVRDEFHKEAETREDHMEISTTGLRKYIYVLPSGRKLKVVVDNDEGPMEATS